MMVNEMSEYFVYKIMVIRFKLDVDVSGVILFVILVLMCSEFFEFFLLFEESVWRIVVLCVKLCVFDFLLLLILIFCLDELFFVIRKIVNLFFEFGVFVEDWKNVLVFFLFKKVGFKFINKNF